MPNFLNTTFKFLSRSFILAAIFLSVFTSTVSAQTPEQTAFINACVGRNPGKTAECRRCALEFTDPAACERTITPTGSGNPTSSTKATVNFIKVDGKENEISIATNQRYVVSWSASNAALCGITTNEDRFWSVPPSGSIREEDWGTLFSNTDSIIYTITCYTQGQRYRGDTEFTVVNPLSETTPLSRPFNTQGESTPKSVTVTIASAEEAVCEEDDEKCQQICENYPDSTVCGNCKVNPDSEGCLEQCLESGQPICTGSASEVNETAAPTPKECGLFGSWGQCAIDAALYILKATIVSLAASFLQLSAYIFEYSIQLSVAQFSNLVNSIDGSGAWLTEAWSIIRDILNIGVIFVLLYAAINVIVGRGGEIKKVIAGVILFGVLTNFSLFLTKAALDITNVIALEFYQQMRTLPLSETGFSGGLGASVVSITGLTNFYDANPIEGDAELNSTGNQLKDSFLYLFAMTFVFVAVGFIFLQAAGMFILRTITVILLLIFSPLMFAGAIFSPLQKWIEQWHKEFIGQITVAPIFMLLLYIVLTILNQFIKVVDTQFRDDSTTDMFGFLALVILTSALTIFGFGAALSQAKKYAGTIGNKGAQWGGKVGGFALGKTIGGTSSVVARLGQNTLGRIGQAADRGTGGIAKAAQFLGINKLKDASFDVRNSKTAAKVGGGVSRALSAAAGIPVTANAGPGIGGLQTRNTAAAEAQKKRNEAIQAEENRRIEDEFKRIDGNVKKYQITDAKIVDETGNEITRTAADTDEIWEGKVKKANAAEKTRAQDKKKAFLASLSTDSRSTSEKGKAAFRAKKAAEEKMNKAEKATKDNEKNKEKLKGFKDELKKMFASDASQPPAPPLNAIRISKTQAEIDGMTDQEISSMWEGMVDTIKTEFTRFKAQAGASLTTPSDPNFNTAQGHKNKFEALLKKAENAKKTMDNLKKSIDAHEAR